MKCFIVNKIYILRTLFFLVVFMKVPTYFVFRLSYWATTLKGNAIETCMFQTKLCALFYPLIMFHFRFIYFLEGLDSAEYFPASERSN